MKLLSAAAVSSLQLSSLLISLSFVASSATAAAAATTTNNKNGMKALLQNARRLEQNNGGNGDDGAAADAAGMTEEEMEAFLVDYSLKFMKCVQNKKIYDVYGAVHYGAVIFRLCPSGSCDDSSGCRSGYADFAVDVGTYVTAFMEDQADNMNWDDGFDVDSFGECTEYLQNDDEDGNEGSGAYVGPGCTEDGTGVKTTVFVDQYCSVQATDDAFKQISEGWSLPYSNGGLVSTECSSCVDYNENGEGQLREMCMELYNNAPYRCEADFDFDHYYYDAMTEIYRYGKDKTGCTSIELMQTSKSFSGGAKATDLIFAFLLLALAAGGFAYYTIWWKKSTYFSIWKPFLIKSAVLWLFALCFLCVSHSFFYFLSHHFHSFFTLQRRNRWKRLAMMRMTMMMKADIKWQTMNQGTRPQHQNLTARWHNGCMYL